MDEDNELSSNIVNPTVNKMDDDNSELPLAIEEQLQTTIDDNNQHNDESSASPLTSISSTRTMPIPISKNISMPDKNDSNTSHSVMETSSLGKFVFYS